MNTFTKNSIRATETFLKLIKKPLQNMLEGEIISVEKEAQASSPTALVLDQSASSDLIVKYKTTSALFFSSSRIIYFRHLGGVKSFPFSITLSDSINNSYEVTEINKLNTAVNFIKHGIPVVVPRYLCFARVYPMDEPNYLYDLLSVETIPIIEHIFSSTHMNISELRMRMRSEGKNDIAINDKLKYLAGIRTNGESGKTFLYISKEYIDMNGIPYLYAKM